MPSSIGSGACVKDPAISIEDPCAFGQTVYQQSQGLVPKITPVPLQPREHGVCEENVLCNGMFPKTK